MGQNIHVSYIMDNNIIRAQRFVMDGGHDTYLQRAIDSETSHRLVYENNIKKSNGLFVDHNIISTCMSCVSHCMLKWTVDVRKCHELH